MKARIRLFACALPLAAFGVGCYDLPTVEENFRSQTIHFDSAPPGQLPTGFSTALTGGGGPISWMVRQDATAPGGPNVLVQESSDDTSYRFPMCIYDDITARD